MKIPDEISTVLKILFIFVLTILIVLYTGNINNSNHKIEKYNKVLKKVQKDNDYLYYDVNTKIVYLVIEDNMCPYYSENGELMIFNGERMLEIG